MVQSYVGSFVTLAAGDLTPQTITGIVDSNGDAFEPKVIIFFNRPNGPFNFFQQFIFMGMGFDDGLLATGVCTETNWADGVVWGSYGSNIDTGFGYSIISCVSRFFTRFVTAGKITAKAVGEFTYTLDYNEFGTDGFSFLALAGDFDYHIGFNHWTQGVPENIEGLSFRPTGGIFLHTGTPAGTQSSSDSCMALGFVGTDLSQASSTATLNTLEAPGEAGKAQKTDKVLVGVYPHTSALVDTLEVTALNIDGFSAVSSRFGGADVSFLLFGGIQLRVASFLQTVADGPQSIDVGSINLKAAIFSSACGVVSPSYQSGYQLSCGAFDGTRQAYTWGGALNGSSDAGEGGSLIGNADGVIFSGTPVGQLSSDTLATGKLSANVMNDDSIDMAWSNCDGVAREVIVFAIGSTVVPPGDRLSGVYKLTPGKLADTFYIQLPDLTTQQKKIPEPFIESFLYGDEK